MSSGLDKYSTLTPLKTKLVNSLGVQQCNIFLRVVFREVVTAKVSSGTGTEVKHTRIRGDCSLWPLQIFYHHRPLNYVLLTGIRRSARSKYISNMVMYKSSLKLGQVNYLEISLSKEF